MTLGRLRRAVRDPHRKARSESAFWTWPSTTSQTPHTRASCRPAHDRPSAVATVSCPSRCHRPCHDTAGTTERPARSRAHLPPQPMDSRSRHPRSIRPSRPYLRGRNINVTSSSASSARGGHRGLPERLGDPGGRRGDLRRCTAWRLLLTGRHRVDRRLTPSRRRRGPARPGGRRPGPVGLRCSREVQRPAGRRFKSPGRPAAPLWASTSTRTATRTAVRRQPHR